MTMTKTEREQLRYNIVLLEAENAVLKHQAALDAPVVAAAEAWITCENEITRFTREVNFQNDNTAEDELDAYRMLSKALTSAYAAIKVALVARRDAMATEEVH